MRGLVTAISSTMTGLGIVTAVMGIVGSDVPMALIGIFAFVSGIYTLDIQ